VAHVALELDFTNEFHFSRRFKQFTGLSPKAYRESHRNR
jgi:AraC-like DNA-binding protein